MEHLSVERKADSYKGKNAQVVPTTSIGVTVQIATKKGKGGRKRQAVEAQDKVSNYDLLRKLGFDKEFIEENRRLGLKEKDM